MKNFNEGGRKLPIPKISCPMKLNPKINPNKAQKQDSKQDESALRKDQVDSYVRYLETLIFEYQYRNLLEKEGVKNLNKNNKYSFQKLNELRSHVNSKSLIAKSIILNIFILIITLAQFPILAQDTLIDSDNKFSKTTTYDYSLYRAIKTIPLRSSSFIEKERKKYPNADFHKFPIEQHIGDMSIIKRIKCGDTIPDEIMDLPLWVVHDSYGRDTISLRQSMDKPWIIIEAWSDICPPCIESMTKWESIYQESDSNFTLMGLYSSYYNYKVVNFIRKRKWESVQIIGKSMAILSHAFFGKNALGPSIWIKNGKLFGISKALSLREGDYKKILNEELNSIPKYASWTD